MANKTVVDAVRARITANWDAGTRGPLSEPNAGGSVPSDDTPFLTVEFPVANEEQISVGAPGSNVFREDGAFRIVLSVPAGHTTSPYDQWIEDLRALFRGQVFEGVTTWSASPSTDNGLNETGAYYELSFAVPYKFDTFA